MAYSWMDSPRCYSYPVSNMNNRRKKRSMAREQDACNYTELNLTTDFSSIASGSWVIVDLLQIAAGTGEQERLRNAVTVGNIHINGTLVGGQANGVADDVYNTVRMVVVRASESLVSADWSSVSLNDPTLRIAFPKVKTFLKDKRFVISTYGLNSTGYIARAKGVSITIPVNDTFYWENASATTHINESLFIAFRSDSGAVPNPGFVTPSKVWLTYKPIIS